MHITHSINRTSGSVLDFLDSMFNGHFFLQRSVTHSIFLFNMILIVTLHIRSDDEPWVETNKRLTVY